MKQIPFSYAFSLNGEKTVFAKNDKDETLGRTSDLSQGDIEKINHYYSCGRINKASTKPKDIVNNNDEDDGEGGHKKKGNSSNPTTLLTYFRFNSYRHRAVTAIFVNNLFPVFFCIT